MSLEILLRRRARTVNSTSSTLSSTSRISTSCDMNYLIPLAGSGFWSCLLLGRSERKEKRRSLIKLRFRPNPPTVFPNNPLHNRQAHSCALEIPSPMQALKHTEEFARVLHLEAG